MYIKAIYDEWDLHPDATQLEIKYRFITNFIDILDTKTLGKIDYNQQPILITELAMVEKWKSYKVQKILKQFKDISCNNDIHHGILSLIQSCHEAFFLAGQILNELKVTNYKASSLEVYYEPKLLLLAKKYLEIENYEKWVCSLSDRIFTIDETILKSYIGRRFDWIIETDHNHLKNTFWFLENCMLFFRDITSWYYELMQTSQLSRERAINIVNHLLIYGLTDFYAKYYTEVKQDSFQHVYRNLLIEIAVDVNAQVFALTVFTEIAMFLHTLIKERKILATDAIINNYLGMIKICCSQRNYDKFANLIVIQDYIPTNQQSAISQKIKTINLNTQPMVTANFEIPLAPLHATKSANLEPHVAPPPNNPGMSQSEQISIPFFEPSEIDTVPQKENRQNENSFGFNTIPFDIRGDRNE